MFVISGDSCWSFFSLVVRKKRSAEVALAKQTAKVARIDGSANQELAGDDSAALTGRVEFSHERFRAKTYQSIEVNADLNSGLMAKLMIDTDDDGRTETWQVGRLKSAKEVRVVLPQGGTAVSCYTFVWQALDAAGRVSGNILSDLSLDVLGCGTTREWVMVEPKWI
jgi:hypothetical protein